MKNPKDLVGQKLPEVTFKTREDHNWVEKTTKDFFADKKVVVFALPGAFTPTCSSTHLPRYEELYDCFKEIGIDEVVCLSVNDAFVMNSWKESQHVENVKMLPDGNGEFSEKLGFLVDKTSLGFGKRSWRYSMLVDDGVVKKVFAEEERDGDPFDSSNAETMLKHLKPDINIMPSIAIYTRVGCEHCHDAKESLKKAGFKFEEHLLNRDYSIKTLVAISGTTQVPQIFRNGERIGGNAELQKVLKK